jgi:hypothetical protein
MSHHGGGAGSEPVLSPSTDRRSRRTASGTGVWRTRLRAHWRGPLTLLALLIAGSTAIEQRGREATADRLERLLDESGLAERRPEIAASIQREQDPAWAANQLARALLADELDRRWIAGLPEKERSTAIDEGEKRLAIAAELARGVLLEHPSSWEAALVLGGTRYLQIARRLVLPTEGIDTWERPLLLALELGPGRLDAERLLAAAYVSQWASLDRERRERAPEILRSALSNKKVFDSLIEPWLRVAPSREVAFSALPDTPDAWGRLEAIYRDRRDWALLGEARDRWYGALRTELTAVKEEAIRRRRTGDSSGALRLFTRVARETPREATFGGLLSEAILEAPLGWIDPTTAESLRAWISWTVEHAVLGEPALQLKALHRLTTELELTAPLAAAAAVLTGEGGREVFHERLAGPDPAPEWLPFLSLKAISLVDARPEEAERTLRRLPTNLRSDPIAVLAEARVGPVTTPEVGAGGSWRSDRAGDLLAVFPAQGYRGLSLRFTLRGGGSEAPAVARGAAEIRLDGRLVRTIALGPQVSVSTRIEPGPHLLEILAVGGERPNPGIVTFLR